MKIQTLRARLIILYSVILMLILFIFSTILFMYFQQNLKKNLDEDILSHIMAIEHSVEETGGHIDLSEIQEIDQYQLSSIPKFIQIMTPQKQTLVKSSNLGDFSLMPSSESWQRILENHVVFANVPFPEGGMIRYAAVPIYWGKQLKFIVVVGLPMDSILRPVKKLFITILVLIPFTLIITWFGGWLFANRALRPLQQITKTAKTISANKLNQQLRIQNAGKEIQELIDVFNQMILRLHDSFHQIRRFTADASHELRTPLTVVKGESEIALRQDRTLEEYRETLQRILDEANYMTKIVENLLTLSRIDAGQLSLNFKPIDLTKLVQGTAKKLELLVKDKDILLELKSCGSVFVRGDSERLEQVIQNLLDNSIKYTDPGGKIVLDITTKNSFVLFTISDTGIGIPESEVPYIFDRFYRVDKARSRKIGGSGLGLSIVQWIVAAHNGIIEVDSKLKEGTVVRVKLPLKGK